MKLTSKIVGAYFTCAMAMRKPNTLKKGEHVALEGDMSHASIEIFGNIPEDYPIGSLDVVRIGGSDIWKVAGVDADPGYGPLLYDLAMEFIYWLDGKNGGLVPDTFMVSREAREVWRYYYERRTDIKKTPEPDYVKRKRQPHGTLPPYLNYVYSKPNTRYLDYLKRKGKLITSSYTHWEE